MCHISCRPEIGRKLRPWPSPGTTLRGNHLNEYNSYFFNKNYLIQKSAPLKYESMKVENENIFPAKMSRRQVRNLVLLWIWNQFSFKPFRAVWIWISFLLMYSQVVTLYWIVFHRKKYRRDYSGGVLDEKFFLKNCGFFCDKTKLDTSFVRKPKGKPPTIRFEDLK